MAHNPNVTNVLEQFKADVKNPKSGQKVTYHWQLNDPYKIIIETAPANEFDTNYQLLQWFVASLNQLLGKENYAQQKAAIIPLVERLLYAPTLPAVQTIAWYVWEQLPEEDRLEFSKVVPKPDLEGP